MLSKLMLAPVYSIKFIYTEDAYICSLLVFKSFLLQKFHTVNIYHCVYQPTYDGVCKDLRSNIYWLLNHSMDKLLISKLPHYYYSYISPSCIFYISPFVQYSYKGHGKMCCTVQFFKIQIPIELPVRIVNDGPYPPISPPSTPHCLVVRPKIGMVIDPNSKHHKNSYVKESQKVFQLEKI